MSKNGDGDPATLKFRCGYVGSQMLAFGWNDPVPPAESARAEPRSTHSTKGKHSTKRQTRKRSKRGDVGKSSGQQIDEDEVQAGDFIEERTEDRRPRKKAQGRDHHTGDHALLFDARRTS